MTIHNVKIANNDRNSVIKFIEIQKSNGPFTVIDVGGSLGGWSMPVVDAIVDFNEPIIDPTNKNIKQFKCDITHPDSWIDIIEYVKEHGKFNFCICSHTLEDIMNPVFVCEQIEKIADSGYIAVPSKYRELSRFETGYGYRGYIHHRWIFDIIDNVFIGYPKINYLDSNSIFDQIADINEDRSDLSFYWESKIDIKYINNNYLGPNVTSVMRYYENLLKSSSV